MAPVKHPISKIPNSFGMSSYLQDHVSYIGQKEVFEEGSETLGRLLHIEVGNKQIQRVSEYFGGVIEEHIDQLSKTCPLEKEAPKLNSSQERANSQDKIQYAMADGSMVFTREEGWKEVKLGRVFTSDSNVEVSKDRKEIMDSEYTAYLGDSMSFLERFELLIKTYLPLVFIADGARWFWEWANIYYPGAIQILDYYHCKEYLCEFARLVFKDKQERKIWIEQQETLLFSDQLNKVIGNIRGRPELTEEAKEYQEKILTYYENNKERMYYGTYKQKGLLIGSGPIESAHRNVIQKRLKLSGQRWKKQGLQRIANLRVVHKSNKWEQVVNIAKYGKVAA